jgi:multidrug efflux pump
VDEAINEFMISLWQAIAIILVISFASLGGRAGLVVALSFPLTLAIVFPVMQIADIDLQRISLGALIIALGLLVDNAMTTIDVVTVRLAAGDDKVKAASYAYESVAMPMLTGTFITAPGSCRSASPPARPASTRSRSSPSSRSRCWCPGWWRCSSCRCSRSGS